VTALPASSLVDNHQVRLQDYYAAVPGLSVALDNRGAPTTAVRGITTTIYGNPTVGITMDDVPFGATTASAFSWATTDFDPNELSRIEVLRGPQGTLYGASSLGGLIKYETIAPSPDAFEARVQASTSDVKNGRGLGYGISGATNVPVTDSFAVRVSAFTRQDPGYVDNLLTGQRGVNEGRASGGRLSTLWRASEDWSVKMSALLQRSKIDASPNIVPSLGDLKQSYIRDSGGYDKKLQAYDVTVRGRLGGAELISITGYGVSTSAGSFDTTSLPAVVKNSMTFFGVPFTAWVEDNDTRKFSQEVRFSGELARFDWLAGGFYTDESTDLDGGQNAFIGVTGQRLGPWFSGTGEVTYRETAGFLDLTYHFTERFDVQVGSRYGQNDQTFKQTNAFGFNPPSTSDTLRSDDRSVTYLLVPSVRLSADAMLYARLASGYRPGGPNSALFTVSTHPHTFGPDKTENYELGFKAQFLDHTLFFDASVYRIDWQDLQIGLVDTNTSESWATNLGRARSEGLDVSIDYRPTATLKVGAWAAWNDAKLTEDFSPEALSNGAAGSKGDRLPYSSRFSANASVQQDFLIGANVNGFVGLSVAYVGEREGEIPNGFGGTRQTYPAYTKTDLRLGGTYADWSLNVYANNLTDKRGVIAGGQQTLNALAFTYIQPRTIGMSLTKTFR
jgi:outer membrane receptor protein involved in Fe transport